MDLGLKTEKNNVGIRTSILEIPCLSNFQEKQTTLTFLAQICPKIDLGLEIQETNVGIKISILKITCVPVFRNNEQL